MSDERAGNAERVERGGQKRANEDDVASKMLLIQNKRFYVDVKQNQRGRFIKIAEMGSHQTSRIVLSMTAAVALRDGVEELVDFSKEHPESENEEEKELKSSTLNFDTRRYYLDLKQNKRGRFLRIAQTVSVPVMSRSQVVVPASGMDELLGALRDLIDEYSEGYLDHQLPPSNLPEATQMRAENGKMFYMDAGQNDRGAFIRISEVKKNSGYRTAITVPAQSLVQFRDAISEMIDKFSESKVDGKANETVTRED